MSPKINKSKLIDTNDAIRAAKAAAVKNASELLNLSFKYLSDENEKFKCFHQELTYYIHLLKRLRSISSAKLSELHANRSSALRMHPINWTDTTETCFNFPRETEIVDTPYQISLSSNEGGRLHGFFIINTFYIVWFDKEHLLYA